jgi:hypothetical protein
MNLSRPLLEERDSISSFFGCCAERWSTYCAIAIVEYLDRCRTAAPCSTGGVERGGIPPSGLPRWTVRKGMCELSRQYGLYWERTPQQLASKRFDLRSLLHRDTGRRAACRRNSLLCRVYPLTEAEKLSTAGPAPPFHGSNPAWMLVRYQELVIAPRTRR